MKTILDMNTILIVIFLSIIGVIGDFFIKISGNGEKFMNVKFFLIGLIIYASTAFGWFYAMKHMKLSTLGVIYSLSTVLLLVAVGVIYFHDKLKVYEIIGIVAAIISIVLLSRFT